MWLVWKAPHVLAGPVPSEPASAARDAEIAAAATRYAYRADVITGRTGLIAALATSPKSNVLFPGRHSDGHIPLASCQEASQKRPGARCRSGFGHAFGIVATGRVVGAGGHSGIVSDRSGLVSRTAKGGLAGT